MEDRQLEIQECRRELQSLTRQVDALSVRLDRLEGKAAPVPKKPAAAPAAEVPGQAVRPAPAQKEPPQTDRSNLEGLVGKNLFAVLASVLVLLGVGVFVSTIYEHIPEMVKIGAIYLFGFALLGGGLAVYRRNGNKFWLGVASCGLAELLVSVITSHSYFQVLSLPWTFALILVWILGSFWLTRFQPTVFKTIGYCGLIISMLLGLSLVGRNDTAIYMTLFGSFVALAVFFMVTHRDLVKLNTALALCSVIALTMFQSMGRYLPEYLDWLPPALILTALGAFHGAYLAVSKLHPKAYPFFAALTLWIGTMYLGRVDLSLSVPVTLALILALWFLSQRSTLELLPRLCYILMAGLFLVNTGVTCRYGEDYLQIWFLLAALACFALYWLTRQRDVAWLGLVAYGVLCLFRDVSDPWTPWTVLGALGFFALYSSPLVREDKPLRGGWYLLTLAASWLMMFWIRGKIYEGGRNIGELIELSNCVYCTVLAVVNTAYLHLCLRDQQKILRIDLRSVAVMIPQVLLILSCLGYVDSSRWYVCLMGVAASLLTVTYSLYYSLKTRGADKRLMIWQFVKFTLYCCYVLWALESPDILLNISLLVIAIAAIILGFRLGHKSVRIYGLVLSLVDVVGLVLFNIDFSDSLQLAGGIVLCGALCFVISFIYSRISRTALNKDAA